MFQRWSNQKVQFYSLLVILGGILVILTLATLTSSLSCIDENGCLIYSCIYHRFSEEYVTLIDISINNNPKCCWKRYDLINQCIGGYDNEAYYENNSCQSDVNALVIENRAVLLQTSSIDIDTEVGKALTQLADPTAVGNDAANAVAQPTTTSEDYKSWLDAAVTWVKTQDF